MQLLDRVGWLAASWVLGEVNVEAWLSCLRNAIPEGISFPCELGVGERLLDTVRHNFHSLVVLCRVIPHAHNAQDISQRTEN